MLYAVNINAVLYNVISNSQSVSIFNTKQKALLRSKHTLQNIKPRFKSKLSSINFSNQTIWMIMTSPGTNMA